MKTEKELEILLLAFCTFIFISCSNDDSKETFPDTPETGDSYISPVVPQGHIEVEALKSHTEPFLGAGYDITGDYASNFSVKESVLDISKIDDDRISSIKGNSGEGYRFVGRDVKDFLQSVATDFVVPAENRDDLLFTGTVTGHGSFDEPYDYSSQYTFVFEGSGAKMVIQRLLTLSPKWSSWLSDEFQAALDQESPEAVVERFGTHVLINAYLGYSVRTLYRSVVADNELELLRTAITGLGARRSIILKFPNVTITYPEETVRKNNGGAIVVSFQGGDYKSLPHITLTPNEVVGDPMDIRPWIQTSNEDTYALATLSGKDLLPIYNVITDPVKKQQVKEAVTAHIKARQLSLQKTAPILQASDGKYHRYYTSYEKLSESSDVCQGVIGSVFVREEAGTVPLYLSSNKGNHRLSLVPASRGDETIIGYVYEKWSNQLNCIYEISDGKSFAYTTERKDSYGENDTWKPTGNYFYTKKV